MYILIIIILLLFFFKNRFIQYKKQINTTIIVLSVWLVTGLILRHFLTDNTHRRYTDVEMAQVLIKNDPEFKKAKMKILDDGSVRLILRKRKYFHLKDGVLTNGK